MKKKAILQYIKEEAKKLGFKKVVRRKEEYDFFIKTKVYRNKDRIISETNIDMLFVNPRFIKAISKLNNEEFIKKSLRCGIKHERGHIIKPSCDDINDIFIKLLSTSPNEISEERFSQIKEVQANLNAAVKLYNNTEEFIDSVSTGLARGLLSVYSHNLLKFFEGNETEVKQIIDIMNNNILEKYYSCFNKKFRNQVIEGTWKYLKPYL